MPETEAPACPARRLAGRVAVVTGAAGGIGRAIAARLAAEGAAVVVADIDGARAQATAAALGPAAIGARTDIADEASVAALAAVVEARFGRCEILVNNAAVTDACGFGDLTFAHYRRVTAINQDGAIRVTLAMLPLIRKGEAAGRRILNIASIQGVRGARDSLAYGTAKGAIVNFTRALACDLADEGILVNALAPGFIDTPMAALPDGSHEHDAAWFRTIYVAHGRIPLRRGGSPEDIAGPAFFLCSDDARYVTGQVLLADGGLSATF